MNTLDTTAINCFAEQVDQHKEPQLHNGNFSNKDAESIINNLIDEIEIDKVIHGPILEQQCTMP